ncbi:MAG TPA: molecular chaperone DnaJ [Gaiellaceae bacterium]|nr:molecular chaperone DnaJ [Gaiellaceae bacterium]
MATAERDYYELLGVARAATEEEIKKAFRKLARELHPDVSDEPDAQARFREVAEAYEVLSKPDTRKLYDQYGHAGLKRGGYTPGDFDFGNLGDIFSAFFGDDLLGRAGRSATTRGGDLALAVEIDLAEAYSGITRRVELEVAQTCERCAGDGAEPGTTPITCGTCAGAGRVQQVSRSVFGEFVRAQACPTCSGTGRVAETPCLECAAAGRTMRAKTLDVEIPAGIHSGQQIRIRGEGHAGTQGGPTGDLYVEVHIRRDERFERDGNDILASVDLTIVQAALGAKLSVPTLEGETELEFEPGTQPGEVRVLKGKGMPALQRYGRGDHRVLVNVAVPRKLNDEQRKLLEQFDGHTTEDTYRRDETFFEKLRSALR